MEYTGNYYVVFDWMTSKLELRGNELSIFAIIYGFSQDNESTYHGSLSTLERMTNLSKPTVLKALKSLVDKKLITKEEIFRNSVKYCEYRQNIKSSKESLPVVKNCTKGSKETLHNSKVNISKEEIYKEESSSKPKKFIKPTLDEVRAYCKERNNNVDPEEFIDSNEQKGWVVGKNKTPMKDWKAAIRIWERNNFSNKKDSKKEDNTFKPKYRLAYKVPKDFYSEPIKDYGYNGFA